MSDRHQSSAPIVSIIVPSYNHARYVGITLEALRSQDFASTELVFIDDGSKDQTRAVVEELRPALDSRFVRTTIRFRENRGLAATLNELIASASGRYLFYMASDDVPMTHAISTLVRALESSPRSPVLACGDASFVDESGRQLWLDERSRHHSAPGPRRVARFVEHYRRLREDDISGPGFGSYRSLLLGNYLPIGFLVKREAALRAGPYPEGLQLEDLYFWLQLSKVGAFELVPDTLGQYRIHGANVSRNRQSALHADYLRILLWERSHCVRNGLEREWLEALARGVSLRDRREWLLAWAFGVPPARVASTRVLSYARRWARLHARGSSVGT